MPPSSTSCGLLLAVLCANTLLGCDDTPAMRPDGALVIPQGLFPASSFGGRARLVRGALLPWRRAMAWTWQATAGEVLRLESLISPPVPHGTVLSLHASLPTYTSEAPIATATACPDEADASSRPSACLTFTALRDSRLFIVVHRRDLRDEGDFTLSLACSREGDADCDGVASESDCDDADPTAHVREASPDFDGDGRPDNTLDGDCDGFAMDVDCDDAAGDSTHRFDDADCDGVRTVDDCDDGDTDLGARERDRDCDGEGPPLDCDDEDPTSNTRLFDADCDGTLHLDDCDDNDPTSTTRPADADCDGVEAAEDCDDGDPASTTRASDRDCDGLPFDADCDDADPNANPRALDGDCDGLPADADCDDTDPDAPPRALDGDCDGLPIDADCDDADPDANPRALDGDCDGLPVGVDCDDADPHDLDCDGAADPVGFRLIPPGTFVAGSPETETGRASPGCTCAETQTTVTLTRPLWVGEAEVTQGEWLALSGGVNPSAAASCGADCPVEQVSWWSALAFANARSEAEGLRPCYRLPPPSEQTCSGAWPSGDLDCGDGEPELEADTPYACEGYRLPTEAEWEYAARAGTSTATYGGDLRPSLGCLTPLSGAGALAEGTFLHMLGWYQCTSEGRPHPARGLRPNGWGLFDMLGNVEEWTWDRIWSTASSFNGVEGGLDPVRRGAGGGRVLRGGSWREQEPAQLRAAARSALVAGDPRTADDRGFRLVRTAAPPD